MSGVLFGLESWMTDAHVCLITSRLSGPGYVELLVHYCKKLKMLEKMEMFNFENLPDL